MAGVIAENYSDALYMLALEEGQSALYDEQLQWVCDSLRTNQEFYAMLQHPKLKKEEKKKVLEDVYANSISRFLLSFLQLLIDKGRFSYLFDIQKQYRERYYQESNKKVVYIETAKALQEEEKQRLHEALEKKWQKQVEIVVEINEDLIAGLRMKVDDQVFDYSAKARLRQLKKTIDTAVISEER
ncbi:MAG: ATP synthase F1 subunit delta [Erysipelotrichaceae bacterium]|nr:ATP synthase F1 subunit delta [Erysipelotrichaceae bacterium]